MAMIAVEPGAADGQCGVLPPSRHAVLAGMSRRILDGLDTPGGRVLALIAATALARLLLARWMGLGIDESYMAAAARRLQLSYFDHPPVAWWLAWAAEQLGGPGNDVVIRLPFIALFAVSTWLMFRLTTELFDEAAGLWAAIALNAAPVLGIATGTWILPDGPLDAALLGGVLCFRRATERSEGCAWPGWIGAGICFGIALCAKYTALPILLGLGAYLVTTPSVRPWLRRPHPYRAAAIAVGSCTPVIVWNIEHGFASLRFQGDRAFGGHLHVFGPLLTMGGEALFFLPWLFFPLLVLLWRALRRGPADAGRWLLACLAVPSFVLFELVSLHSHVLFHWAAPALMFALPLLGQAIAQRRRAFRAVRFALVATAATAMLGVSVVASEVHFNWLPGTTGDFAPGTDPDLAAVDWTSIRTDLRRRDGLSTAIVGAVRWIDAGKIDFALRGRVPVICLGDDPRQYGIVAPVAHYVGRDVLILAPRETYVSIEHRFGTLFHGIEEVPPFVIRHAGTPAMIVPAFLGHRLQAPRWD